MAAAKAAGKKRRYATITIRDNAFRMAMTEGVPYVKGSASKVKKAAKKKQAAAAAAPPETEDVVEKLLDTRRVGAGREYLVKWWGYEDKADLTWETADNLNDALDEYEGYAQNIEPKLSQAEKSKAKAGKTALVALSKKVNQKTTASAGGKKAGAERSSSRRSAAPAAAAPAAGRNKRKREAEPAPAANATNDRKRASALPKKGDRVDVEFARQGSFVGTVTAGPRRVAAKGKGKKVMAFDVLFDADGVTVTVSQEDIWSFH